MQGSSLRCLSTSTSFPTYNPTNTEQNFKSVNTAKLFTGAVLFQATSYPSMARVGLQILKIAGNASEFPPIFSKPVAWVLQNTLFRYFCAGETIQDCQHLATQLSNSNVKVIIDHSVEEGEREEDWKSNLEQKLKLLSAARAHLDGQIHSIPIKITALVCPTLLEKITTIITSETNWMSKHVDPIPALSEEQLSLLHRSEENLLILCREAKSKTVMLLIDAEQSHRQPAVDWLALRLMQRFNTGSSPVVYNTYQMYLRGAIDRVQRDLEFCKGQNITFAAKVVRGAYISAEKSLALKLGVEPPLVDSKKATDEQYDTVISLILHRLKEGQQVAMVVATHNHTSIGKFVQLMDELEIPRNHPMVQTAQILGMSDNLTFALGLAGFNSHKLILFGDFYQIAPWLFRRVEENSDLLSAMSEQRHLLWEELRRRFKRVFMHRA